MQYFPNALFVPLLMPLLSHQGAQRDAQVISKNLFSIFHQVKNEWLLSLPGLGLFPPSSHCLHFIHVTVTEPINAPEAFLSSVTFFFLALPFCLALPFSL